MDVDGYLSSQFIRKVLQHLTLINCLLISPQKVKPFDDPLLQVLGHLVRNGQVYFWVVLFGTCIEKHLYTKAQANLISASVKRKSATDLAEAHVLFDCIDSGLEVSSGSIHVCDHGTNITDNGGKYQHTHLEVK